MRAVVQRVKEARVDVEGGTVGEIGNGLLVLLGVGEDDSEKDLSLIEMEGAVLVVSQFTLWGDCRKGRRPSFTRAARPEKAKALYEHFVGILRGKGLRTATGEFQEMMDVHLVNDGPVTLILDSSKTFY
jgi:D-tyrosyl-tRNA(Tyr) deacylase